MSKLLTEPVRITAWSYSRYNDYQQCPFKAKCKIILRLKEPGSVAMDRGSGIHKKIENYLTGAAKRIPPEAKSLEKEYKAIKAKSPEVERELAFNSKWEPCSWFDRSAWCRVKMDAVVLPTVENPIVRLIDHKTGKLQEFGKYDEQLELYALAGLLTYQIAEKAKPSLLFVDAGKEVPSEEYSRKDVPKLKKKWELRIKPMLSDAKFKPVPGHYCNWCHFRKANGGPCVY